MASSPALVELVAALPSGAQAVLELDRVREDGGSLAQAFAAAGRRLRGCEAGGDGADPWLWQDVDRVRVLLVAASPGGVRALPDLYRHGDVGERRAVLRALDVLDVPTGLGAHLVADALRSSDPRLVAAALGPRGAAALSEQEFGSALLKCVFCDLDPCQVPGARARTTPAVARRLAGLVHERAVAGRPAPPGLLALAALHPDPEAVAALRRLASGPLEAQVRHATRALAVLDRAVPTTWASR